MKSPILCAPRREIREKIEDYSNLAAIWQQSGEPASLIEQAVAHAVEPDEPMKWHLE